jgi:hypothetical protein
MTAEGDWPTPPRSSEHPTRIIPPIPDPPEPPDDEDENVVLVSVIAVGVALSLVVVGLAVLGWQGGASRDVAITGLASIGSALAGGFAGWIARGRA